MRRRDFVSLLGAAAIGPLAARAQQPALPTIGFLNGRSASAGAVLVDAFRRGLGEIGFVENRNVVIEYRWADGHNDRLPALAGDLVSRNISVVFAQPTAAALAAKRATTSIPIVFLVGGDPVEFGLVDSLNRPGGNATGVSFLVNKLIAKRLELLSELVPQAAALGMLVDPTNPNAKADTKDAQTSADALGRKLLIVTAAAENEIDAAFDALVHQRTAAVFVAASANLDLWSAKIIALAAQTAMAASFATSNAVAAGGLMSYGTDLADAYVRPPSTSAASSKARNRPTYRSRSPLNSNWQSTSRPPRHSASPCRKT
jgi:putative ABC transport system substrate-binding protein